MHPERGRVRGRVSCVRLRPDVAIVAGPADGRSPCVAAASGTAQRQVTGPMPARLRPHYWCRRLPADDRLGTVVSTGTHRGSASRTGDATARVGRNPQRKAWEQWSEDPNAAFDPIRCGHWAMRGCTAPISSSTRAWADAIVGRGHCTNWSSAAIFAGWCATGAPCRPAPLPLRAPSHPHMPVPRVGDCRGLPISLTLESDTFRAHQRRRQPQERRP